MRKRTLMIVVMTVGVAALVTMGTVSLADTTPKLAEVMPKLAKEYTFPQSPKSPGKVTFNHESHVTVKDADCTQCHPRLFRILEPGKTADGQPIRHEAMEAKRQCGVCHDGTKAFGLKKDCDTCHTK
jgi:c(7)-type cytochrome triheme protein